LGWTINYSHKSFKQLKKLDKQNAKRILDFLDFKIAKLDNPRSLGKPLKGDELGEFWRYRIGDFRIIVNIQDKELIITTIKIGHRRNIYQS